MNLPDVHAGPAVAGSAPAQAMTAAPLPGSMGWRWYAALAGCASFLLSVWSVTVRWLPELPIAPRPEVLGASAMSLLTAVCVAALSMNCVLAAVHGGVVDRRWRALLCGPPLLVAVAVAIDYALQIGEGAAGLQDRLPWGGNSGRMSLPTAFSIMLLAGTLFVATAASPACGRASALGRAAAGFAAGLPYYAVLAALFGRPAVPDALGQVALSTATALLLLGTAVLLLYERPSPTSTEGVQLASRRFVAALLPLPLLLPGMVVWVQTVASRLAWNYETSGLALSVSVATLMLIAAGGLAVHWLRLFETELVRSRDAEHEARLAAEAASRAKSRFLSHLSHELKTPLNAVIGFSELLLSNPQARAAPAVEQHTPHILDAGKRLLAMVDDLLELSSTDADQLSVELRPTELEPVLRESVALVQARASKRRVSIHSDLPSPQPSVLADAGRLRQVLVNLLSNAILYNHEGGAVRLTVQGHEKTVEIVVEDTGAGMSASQMSHLFTPFNRLGREGGPVEGAGIGLALSCRFIQKMGGRIEASSTEGEGSRFTVVLPRS